MVSHGVNAQQRRLKYKDLTKNKGPNMPPAFGDVESIPRKYRCKGIQDSPKVISNPKYPENRARYLNTYCAEEGYMRSFKLRKPHKRLKSQKPMETATIKIVPKNPASKWVALDAMNKIIAEGLTPDDVRKEAEKKTSVFFLMFISPKGAINYY
jgi:hypothetical protein